MYVGGNSYGLLYVCVYLGKVKMQNLAIITKSLKNKKKTTKQQNDTPVQSFSLA